MVSGRQPRQRLALAPGGLAGVRGDTVDIQEDMAVAVVVRDADQGAGGEHLDTQLLP